MSSKRLKYFPKLYWHKSGGYMRGWNMTLDPAKVNECTYFWINMVGWTNKSILFEPHFFPTCIKAQFCFLIAPRWHYQYMALTTIYFPVTLKYISHMCFFLWALARPLDFKQFSRISIWIFEMINFKFFF